MKTSALPLLFLIALVSCYSDGTGEDATQIAELKVNLATVSEYDSNLDFAQIEYVEVTLENAGNWRFEVAVRHRDEGWDHYADLWEVVDPISARVYGKRVLLHPHDEEQPFTRSQSGIEIPSETKQVLIRAKCKKHGFSGRAVLVDLSALEGDGFSVER